jgi:hypothetical protein
MKQNSPYTATITGCGFLYYEFLRILPLLMSKDSARLLKEEIDNNLLFQVNSQKARLRFLAEFKRRYNALPISFWNDFFKMNELSQRAGLLYVILKTYRLIFDFHFNVTVKRWNSVDQRLRKTDIMMELSELSSRDSFVDSWTDNTKSRCASQYLTILRQAGLLQEKTNKLLPIHLAPGDYEYYIRSGEEWFLEACLLYPYEVNDIKTKLA